MRVAGLATLFVWAALALVACGGDSGDGDATTGGTSETKAGDIGLVSAYCLYGADTQGQMHACELQTNAAQVRSADDEAARWARGELQACGKGAGELCQYYRGGSEGQPEPETP